MKKVLMLDTSIATLNIGDEIINYSIRNNFEELYTDNYIFNLPTHTRTFTWYQKLLYKNRMKPYLEADLKFLCGTNALYSNMLRPMPTWNINIFNCDLYENTILLGVGLGVNSSGVNFYTRYLYKKILSNKYIHSVRDEKTKIFMEKLGFKAMNTGCPTLWGLTKEHCAAIPEKKATRCVFTLTNYEPSIDDDKKMIDVIMKNYDDVYFFPQCIDDLQYLKKINNDERIKVIAPNLYSFDKLLKEKNIDYIGNRLHGGIFALQHKVRSIIIAIDYRALEMHKNYSFQCIKRENIGNTLEQLINSSWNTSISGLDFEQISEWKKQFK